MAGVWPRPQVEDAWSGSSLGLREGLSQTLGDPVFQQVT